MAAANKPNRVFLWCVPRSSSTAFLKCMTYVPNSQVWCEPYLFANLLGPDGSYTAEATKWIKEERNLPEDKDLPAGGYQASKHPFSWIKEELETGNTDKDLVFVKEPVDGITGHYDAIAKGFKHSFLIRHPYKVYLSWKRMNSRAEKDTHKKEEDWKLASDMDFFKNLHSLYHYVKENYEPNPVVIDADDLQNNPAGILRAYCKAVGISYTDALLTWPAGRECMDRKWMIAKELIHLHNRGGAHQETLSSTGFCKPSALPEEQELTENNLIIAKDNMKYYEELYKLRLKV